MEFDFSLWHDGIPGMHPACPPGTDDRFWAARGEVRYWLVRVLDIDRPGTVVSTNARNLGVYFDGNDASDPCSRLGLGVGAGFGSSIPVDEHGFSWLDIVVGTDRGNRSSSLMSMQFQAVSNDCNNVFRRPGSWCMGRNRRAFPGPRPRTRSPSTRAGGGPRPAT